MNQKSHQRHPQLPPQQERYQDNMNFNKAKREKQQPQQFGILKMKLISNYLKKNSKNNFNLKAIYLSMYILSAITSTENNSLPLIEPYFLSLFNSHSALSTIGIMTNISLAIGKPPMSKIMDVFGRSEGIVVAMILYSFGSILTSSSTNVVQYGIARMASALGSQGLQLAQLIIVADTSSLEWRALLTSTITSPWLLTTWIGPIFASWFLSMGEMGYRVIYLIFGFTVPLCAFSMVLVLSREWKMITTTLSHNLSQDHSSPSTSSQELTINYHSQSQTSSFDSLIIQALKQRHHQSNTFWSQAWSQLDIVGLLLLTISCGMLLLPLTWRVVGAESWFDSKRCSCLAVGLIFLILFVKYESVYAKYPVVPIRLLKHRTLLMGSSVCFWHFICQYTYESYFTSFLQVARFTSPRDAQYIQQSYLFTACISAMLCGLLVKWTQRYKIWVIIGILLHGVGMLMMVRSRKLDNPMAEIVISQIIGGFGGGFTTLAAQLGVQAVVKHSDVGISTAVFLTITQIGGAVGSSFAGSVWNSGLLKALTRRLPLSEHHNIEKIVGDLRFTLEYEGINRIKINESYIEVQRILNWLALLGLIPCLVSGMMMANVDLSSTGDHESGKALDEEVESDERNDEEISTNSENERSRLLD
ncbi:hypothetical protein O181_016786 [Austropuccinia psidii MF-1]|uniref:Major facilitator superfamily (MFS) profile domain-containing protein n=1 Tax=Austropuccinia psidii MF-1 TaxID=1389203 RepID=A0A9Q3GRD7_9BASI|nr:hypothetical protein [Austropuccinia psidii MF-1]